MVFLQNTEEEILPCFVFSLICSPGNISCPRAAFRNIKTPFGAFIFHSFAPRVGFEPTTIALHLSSCFHKGWTISSSFHSGCEALPIPLSWGSTLLRDSLYTFPAWRGLARDCPFGVSPNSLRFSTEITFGSCVMPAWISL